MTATLLDAETPDDLWTKGIKSLEKEIRDRREQNEREIQERRKAEDLEVLKLV